MVPPYPSFPALRRQDTTLPMGDDDGVRNAGTGPSKPLEYYGDSKSLAHYSHTSKEMHRCEYTSPPFYLPSRNIDVVPAQAPAPDANYVFSSHCMKRSEVTCNETPERVSQCYGAAQLPASVLEPRDNHSRRLRHPCSAHHGPSGRSRDEVPFNIFSRLKQTRQNSSLVSRTVKKRRFREMPNRNGAIYNRLRGTKRENKDAQRHF